MNTSIGDLHIFVKAHGPSWFAFSPLKSNAGAQPLLEAGATQERTLEGVALQAIVRQGCLGQMTLHGAEAPSPPATTQGSLGPEDAATTRLAN